MAIGCTAHAENKQIPADYDVSDCKNVFQRREPPRSDEGDYTNPKVPVTEADKLKRDIDTLRESIRLDWLDLASKPLTVSDCAALRSDIVALGLELRNLIERFDALP
jgi:hypothetical protein